MPSGSGGCCVLSGEPGPIWPKDSLAVDRVDAHPDAGHGTVPALGTLHPAQMPARAGVLNNDAPELAFLIGALDQCAGFVQIRLATQDNFKVAGSPVTDRAHIAAEVGLKGYGVRVKVKP